MGLCPIRCIAPRHIDPTQLFTGQQLYVLQKSSLVNQGFFPLWDSPDKPSSSSQSVLSFALILDIINPADMARQPPLSAEQIEHGAIWARPIPASPESLEPEDIIQHIVSDCSVCASMVVATDHCRRFGSKVRVAARRLKHSPLTYRADDSVLVISARQQRLPDHVKHGEIPVPNLVQRRLPASACFRYLDVAGD